MASENGQERRETLADIVSEIRAYGAQPPPRLMWLEIADRIEAIDSADAWRGLYTPPVGNAAAMREALDAAFRFIGNLEIEPYSPLDEAASELRQKIMDAISSLPRQCDVGTPDELGMRYKAFCRKHFTPDQLGGNCRKCPLKDRRGWSCQLAWAQTPYEAQEGGAE